MAKTSHHKNYLVRECCYFSQNCKHGPNASRTKYMCVLLEIKQALLSHFDPRPGDAHRPRLYLGISHQQSDYINTIYINVRHTAICNFIFLSLHVLGIIPILFSI